MLKRLIYISRSRLTETERPVALQAIATTSSARNAVLSVTGALLHTGTHFSQVIEGEAGDIDTLMESIKADPRHDEIKVIEHLRPRKRQFADWAPVYTGRATYVQGILNACLERPAEAHPRAKLLQLFREFSRQGMLPK